MPRSLRDLCAAFLAVLIAVVPAWAGSKACAARGAAAGAGDGMPMACCMTEESDGSAASAEAAAMPCCCEQAEPETSLSQALERPGCSCRFDRGTPSRPAVSQEAESALERELRARFDACAAGLVVGAMAPEPMRARAASGGPPSLRAPPPGRARSTRELLSRLCIARL